MSIEAALARIDQIIVAQHELAVGSAPGVSAPASGVSAGTPGGSTSFANVLAMAQSASAQAAGGGFPAPDAGGIPGAVIPQTSWNPERKPIAAWIAPVLQWASQHGWTGTVTSGYRSFSEQSSINASGAFSAPAGRSNHEANEYPRGAVDVTNSAQLIDVLRNYNGPQKLVGGVLGSVDPEHFSATGR